jgi:hypothetical protein
METKNLTVIRPGVTKSVPQVLPPNNAASVIEGVVQGMAVTAYNQRSDFVHLDLAVAGGEVNNVAQFDIDNTKQGHAASLVRFGGLMGVEGNYDKFGVVLDASNTASVWDQVGSKVLGVQAFNMLTATRPVLITEYRLRSSNTTQIVTAPKYRIYNWDGTVIERKINLTKFEEMTDQRNNLLIAYPPAGSMGWILDCQKFIDQPIIDNVTLNALLTIGFADNIGQMTPIR